MECHRVTIELQKPDDQINLRPLGDIHVGNIGWDQKKFEKNIEFVVKHDDYYTIGMGDYIDNIQAWANASFDKRWNPETVERGRMTTDEQILYFIHQWKKVANKSFGMLSGNHEWKTINQQRFIKDFCNPIDQKLVTVKNVDGVDQVQFEPNINPNTGKADTLYHQKYLGRLAIIGLTFIHKKKEIKHFEILALHGGYAGARTGGTINRLEDITGSFDGIDVALMGHSHDTWVNSTVLTGRDRKTNQLYERKILLANTGTFLRGYKKGVDSYVEISPRRAKRVGTVTITFNTYGGNIYGHD